MRFFPLLFRMVRYKSALVLVLFMALSNVIHDPSASSLFGVPTFFMVMALVLVYACATCVNDLADWQIDTVNLKGHKDRPLVTGDAKRADIVVLAIMTAVGAVIFGALVNSLAMWVVVIGLILNTAYSLKPIQVSHRAVLTPFYLAFCYVLVSYTAGFAVAQQAGGSFQWLYLVAFYFLFFGRISLKDFRDRKGDKMAGKPTLILKYGKKVVCTLSTSAILVGSGCLLMAIYPRFYLQVVVIFFLVTLVVIETTLYKTKSQLRELLSVGYGARMGNGILFGLLGTLLLESQRATMADIVVFYGALMLGYGWMFFRYTRSPEMFYFGRKKVT